ncbi:TOS1 [Candida oxycetoniae]|uniref:glucan endo-1,3-beta-D-glucosidase n=1 Tax=Candida oxycetoniae TaxID=497107 RepID=A0AAI9WW28_9ASCO|nr:TOS1 [Candida oxycetoniae]KAI3402513.2 TOS1 [Candida oxycetoniae]
MKFSIPTLITVLSSIIAVDATCEFSGGNYYCSESKKVVYKGIGFAGSYQDVTYMDETTGSCHQQSYSFSGNLSPLDEELSVHFRGPLKLLQFGVYYPSGDKHKRNNRRDEENCSVQHVHHKHKRATEIVEVTQTVYVDSNGNLVTTETPVAESHPETSAAQEPVQVQEPVQEQAPPPPQGTTSVTALAGEGKAYRPISTLSAPTTTSSVEATSTATADGAWSRDSYYTPGNTDNCVFLNYHGGSGSGVWSAAFGNSLSYANSDNSGASSSPVALEEITIGSNKEFVIMSGQQCSGSSCGYYRPGSVAHHGFGGNAKIFIFEFEMPSDNSGSGFNVDMPAVWMLNAKIPRTLQYGDASCSCWATGCGELDLFEILTAGSNKMISHLHDGQGAAKQQTNIGGGGSQDYFARPVSGSFKAAVIFLGDEIHVVQVDDSTVFGSSLDEATVNSWLQQPGSLATLGY